MRFIYFGTPYFSASCLEQLLKHSLAPVAVVCNPDRPTGRKKIMTAPTTKVVAEKFNISVLQPEKLDAAFIEQLRAMQPDFFVVFAYNKIFRRGFLDIPRLGTIGVHPSFLPHYRGPSPFQTALLDGATETGVTLYLLDKGVDSGPVLARSKPVAIGAKETFTSLATKLADAGAEILIETLPKFLAGAITPKPQDESQATFTKKFKTKDGFVAPEALTTATDPSGGGGSAAAPENAAALDRKIRALNPDPGVWTTASNGKRLKLLEAEISRDGALRLMRTQKEGEKPKTV